MLGLSIMSCGGDWQGLFVHSRLWALVSVLSWILVLDFGLSTQLDPDTGARKADGGSPKLADLRSAHSSTGATASSGHREDGQGLGSVV